MIQSGLDATGKPRPRRLFVPKVFRTKTDATGNYAIEGVPVDTLFQMQTTPPKERGVSRILAEVRLVSGENRPRHVSRLPEASNKRFLLKTKFETNKRDAVLGGFHLLVLSYQHLSANETFASESFSNPDNDVSSAAYMHVFHGFGAPLTTPECDSFAKNSGWQITKKDRVLACALDAAGKELGRVELDVKDAAAHEKAKAFLQKFAPQKSDAKKKWEDAFALAAKTDRKVWVRISQRFCGPCLIMSRWLDEQKELLEKDFVILKIDDLLDLNGVEVAKRIWGEDRKDLSIPFHEIFGSDGKPVIDSKGPQGNIGFPGADAGRRHLRKMLMESRKKLTDEEIDKLIKSLPE